MPLTAVLSPAWPDPAPRAAVLLLHGFGSNERDLPGLARWLPPALPWASLRAPLQMGYGQHAWFPLSVEGDMDAAAIAHATDEIWAWVDAHLGENATVVPVGFSQGGCMALELLRTRPERVIAPVMLAGFAAPAAREDDARLAQERPPVFWGRGDADPVIWPDVVVRTREFLAGHAEATTRVYPGLGHSVCEEEMEDVRAFLDGALAHLS